MTDITIPIWSVVVLGATAVMGLYGIVARLLIKLTNGRSNLKDSLAGVKAPSMPAVSAPRCPGLDPDKFVTKDVCSQTQKTMHAEMLTITQAVKHTHSLLDERFDQLTKVVEKNNH